MISRPVTRRVTQPAHPILAVLIGAFISGALALSQAQIVDFPHEETFEHGGAMPAGWISDPPTGNDAWVIQTSSLNGPDGDHTSGSGYYVAARGWNRSETNSMLYLPALDLSGMVQPAIAFWYCISDNAAAASVSYLYLEARQGESWVQIGARRGWSPFFWIEALESLAVHQTTNTLLRFRAVVPSGISIKDVCIDDVRIFDYTNAPSAPTKLTPANGTGSVPVFATLRWEKRADVTGYRLDAGTDGGGAAVPTNRHDGLVLTGSIDRYGLADLQTETTYYWRLTPTNAYGDGPSSPILSFTTGPRMTVTEFPFTETFQNGGATPAGWINGYDDNGVGWHFSNFYSDHTTGSGYYADIDVRYQNPVTPRSSQLISPRFDLSTALYPKLSYWYRKDNGGNYLEVYVFHNGAWRSPYVALHTSQTDGWVNQIVDLSPYKTNDLRICFRGIEHGWWNGDILVGLDDVTIYDDTEIPEATGVIAPTNGAINGFSRGTFSWQSVARADDYLISLGTDGGGLVMPSNQIDRLALGNVTTRAYSGLDYGTTYYWAITPRNQIGEATNIPVWTFTTLPTPTALPFADGFDDDLSAWSVTTASGTLTLSTEDVVEGTHALRATPNATGFFTDGGSTLSCIFQAAANPQLAFWYRVTPGDYADLVVDIYDGTWHNGVWSGLSDQWSETIIDLSGYNTEGGEFIVRLNLNAIYASFSSPASQSVYLDALRLRAAGDPPDPAHTPTPTHAAAGVPVTTLLQWLPGMFSSTFTVYGSTNAAAVSNALSEAIWIASTAESQAGPPMLEGDVEYFWRVVASNGFGAATGDVWRFTTAAPTVFSLPHTQTFDAPVPAAYEPLANEWAALRHDPTRNSPLAAPDDGLLVMEGGDGSVVYWQPGNPALLWDYAAEGGYNWRNTARFTIYLASPGGPCELSFDYRMIYNLNVRDINLRIDLHKGGGWQQVGGDFYPDSVNTNWVRTTLDLGEIPAGTFALRFWSSVKYSEAYNNQGILLDNLMVQATPQAPAAPYGPVPVDGDPAAWVNAPLLWSNGIGTTGIDLYFADASNQVITLDPAARVLDNVLTNRYAPPADLPYTNRYAWRVVAHGDGGLATTGAVWTFTTQPPPLKTLPYCTGFDLDPWADGWTQATDQDAAWAWTDQATAGGVSPEMQCTFGSDTGMVRLISPPLLTTTAVALALSFQQALTFDPDPFGEFGALYLRIQSSADGANWTDESVMDITTDIAPTNVTFYIAENLTGTSHVALVLSGDLRAFDTWAVDHVCISNAPAPPPGSAWAPDPAGSALTAPADTLLSWSNGIRADTIDLYFSTNASLIATLDPSALRIDDQAATGYDPAPLTSGTYYSWRIVSRAADGQTSAGPVWTFRTRSPLLKPLCYRTGFRANPWDEGWTQQNVGCDDLWWINNLPPARAGADLPELVFYADGSSNVISRLVSPPLDTRDHDRICVRFQSDFSYWFEPPGNLELAVQSSPNGIDWVDEAAWAAHETPATNIFLGRSHGDTTYLAWTLRGDLTTANTWAIDDVCVAPALFAGVQYQNGQVVIRWNPIPGQTGYSLWVTSGLKPAAWSNVTVETGTVWTNHLPGNPLYFRIDAQIPDNGL